MTHEHTSDDYLLSAEEALREGDCATATSQLAAALAQEPRSAAALASIPRWIALRQRAVAVTEPRFFGEVALEAWLRRERGELTAAVVGLLRVVAFRPDIPYLAWLRGWVRGREATLALREVGPALADWLSALGPGRVTSPGREENARASWELVRGLREAHPEQAQLGIFEITLLRRLGEGEAACDAAEQLFRASPSWRTAVTAANASLDLERYDLAIDYYQRASQLEPDAPATYLDWGDLCVYLGRLDEAERCYSSALRLDGGCVWAAAALAVVRYRRAPSPETLEAARRWTRAPDVGPRVAELLGDDA